MVGGLNLVMIDLHVLIADRAVMHWPAIMAKHGVQGCPFRFRDECCAGMRAGGVRPTRTKVAPAVTAEQFAAALAADLSIGEAARQWGTSYDRVYRIEREVGAKLRRASHNGHTVQGRALPAGPLTMQWRIDSSVK